MEHRNKRYYENLIMFFIIAIMIYGVYVYFFQNDTKVQPKVVQEIVVKQKSKAIVVQDEIIVKEEIIIEEKTQEIINNTIEEKVIEEPIKEVMVEEVTTKPNTTKVLDSNITKDEIIERAKEKFKNKAVLNDFLRTTRRLINKKIIANDQINQSLQTISTKIRITILQDGTYEEMKYMEGNKILFDINQNNIATLFPVPIDERIKDQFPRYFRMTLRYNAIKDNTNNE